MVTCYVNCHQPLIEPSLSTKPGMVTSSWTPQHLNLTRNPHALQIANYTQLNQPWTWQTPNFAHQRTHSKNWLPVCVNGYLFYVNCNQPLTGRSLSKKTRMMTSSWTPQHSNLTLNPHALQIANYTQLDQPWTWQTLNFAHQRTHSKNWLPVFV